MKKLLALLFVTYSTFCMEDFAIKVSENQGESKVKLITTKYIANFTKKRVANGSGNIVIEEATPYGDYSNEYLVDCQIKSVYGAPMPSNVSPYVCNNLISKMLYITSSQAKIDSAKKSILETLMMHDTATRDITKKDRFEEYPYRD